MSNARGASPEKLPVYVWEAPVRLWHWMMALSMAVLAVTGYFIGAPLPSVPGEASDNFLFGYIRFAHFAAGYVFAIFFVLRIYWAFVGNKYAREVFLVPINMLRPSFWGGMFDQLREYLFVGEGREYRGHNPLAAASMFFMFILGTVFMIVTGFALYGEGLGMDSWAFRLFSSWVIPLFGQSQDLHTWHHLGAWYLVLFAIIHIYIVIRQDIAGHETIISTMINGWRVAKPNTWRAGKP
jgi:Ni/Fe-hydrogenase 1 B-type cytochrome subunit